VFAPLTPPQTANLESDWQDIAGDDNRQSVWSTSQMSERMAQPYMRHSTSSAAKKALDAAHQPGHERRFSLSSTENHERSDTEAQEGTLRIVINRSAGKQPRTANKNIQPTLEVPIPHYRIGTPRFSTQGTPILRNQSQSFFFQSAIVLTQETRGLDQFRICQLMQDKRSRKPKPDTL
jgi:hypothetical protein